MLRDSCLRLLRDKDRFVLWYRGRAASVELLSLASQVPHQLQSRTDAVLNRTGSPSNRLPS